MKCAVPWLVGLLAFAPWVVINQTQTESADKPVDACVQPAKGPIGVAAKGVSESGRTTSAIPFARVGHAAPDFEANAYVDGGLRLQRGLSDGDRAI